MNVATEPAIEVVDLEKRYGTTRAVDGLSITVARGEVAGLLGPNGAGKTTTLEILEGYREPDAGTARVLGLVPWRDGGKLRPRIGVMLQEGGLYPGVKPLEALRLFASYYDDPEDPERLLDLVGLREVENTLVRRLSGGQTQRLSLALSLVGRPELGLLDEPTPGRDPRARATSGHPVRPPRCGLSAEIRGLGTRRGTSCASCAPAASRSCCPPTLWTSPIISATGSR